MAEKHVNIKLNATGANQVAQETRKAAKATQDFASGVEHLGRTFGPVGDKIGKVVSNFAKGGIWKIAASIADSLVVVLGKCKDAIAELFTASNDGAKKAADRIGGLNAEYSKLAASVSRAYTTADAQAKRIAQIEKERNAVAALREAEEKLYRQRRIAAGEDAATVNAEMDAAAAARSRGASASAAQSAARQAEARRNGSWNALLAANSAVAQAEKTLPFAQNALRDYMRETFNRANRYNIRSRASDEEIRQFMDAEHGDDETYKRLLDGVAKAEANIAEAKKQQSEAQSAFNDRTSEYVQALNRAKAVATANAAEELKAANDRAAAERKAVEERRAAEEKAEQDRAAEEAERHDREHRAMLDEIEAEQKKERAAERERHQKRIENIKDETQKQLAAIDREIDKARDLAAKWEAGVGGARQMAFSNWDTDTRRAERDAARASERQARNVRRARDEIARLEAQGRRIAPANAARLERLRRFVEVQDPNNNPALKQQRQLEQRRAKLIEDQKKSIDAILKLLQEGVAL